jgi:hypothetical protein
VEADRGEDMGIVMSKQRVCDFQEVKNIVRTNYLFN